MSWHLVTCLLCCSPHASQNYPGPACRLDHPIRYSTLRFGKLKREVHVGDTMTISLKNLGPVDQEICFEIAVKEMDLDEEWNGPKGHRSACWQGLDYKPFGQTKLFKIRAGAVLKLSWKVPGEPLKRDHWYEFEVTDIKAANFGGPSFTSAAWFLASKGK